MRSTVASAWVLSSYAVTLAAPVETSVPHFRPKITDVSVFKDGHALAMARGRVNIENGWCRTRDVPAPVMGAFWAFVEDRSLTVDLVKAGFVDTNKTRPCLTLDEIVQANVGRKVTVVAERTYTGVLLRVLMHRSERETETSRTLPAQRNIWGSRVSRQVRETRAEETTSAASFVMIRTDDGVHVVKRANIRSITIQDGEPVTTRDEEGRVREISVRVTKGGKPFTGETRVGFVYVQRGIRWIPDYRIDLLDGRSARVSLSGTIVNDLADLEGVDVRLVVGVPNFIMEDRLSPMALREARLALSSYFAPSRSGSSSQSRFLGNHMMSQVVAPVSYAPAIAQRPSVGGEGQQEDLFLYHKPGISLRKGERASVRLLEVTVPYEHIYTWTIPALPPQEMWRHVNHTQQKQLAKTLTGAKAVHEIRLKNTGDAPWTTGPATVFKDDTPLAQQLLTYTSLGNSVDVPVTVATDLNTKKEESEVQRIPNVTIHGSKYQKVTLRGKLTLTNFKTRPIRVYITRQVVGLATWASSDGKIARSNVAEDPAFLRDGCPWYWWSWPWWWYGVNAVSEITWQTTIPKGDSTTIEYDWHYHYAR